VPQEDLAFDSSKFKLDKHDGKASLTLAKLMAAKAQVQGASRMWKRAFYMELFKYL
jgi:hypothetical protein